MIPHEVGIFVGIALILYFGWSLRTGLVQTVLPLSFFVIGFGFGNLVDALTLGEALSIKWVAILSFCFVFGYVLKYFYDVRFALTLAKKGFVKGARLLLLDFRVAAIFIGLSISVLLSFQFFDLATQEAHSAAEEIKSGTPQTGLQGFWLAFYAAWVSSVLFFAVVGVVAGLTALYRPEADVFAARVRILLGGKTGPAVDYIAKRLAEIGYVARLTERKIVVEEYSEEMKAFRLRVSHSTRIKNLYHDVQTDAVGKISFNFDKLAPEPESYGALAAFRINGGSQPDVPAVFPKDGFLRSWAVAIPGDEEGVLSYEHWCWYNEATEHKFNLGRFTERLDLEIKSRCCLPDKKIKVNLTSGTRSREILLDYDQDYPVEPILDHYPGTVAYSFKLSLEPWKDSPAKTLNPPQTGLQLAS